jgi:hypothetical protein
MAVIHPARSFPLEQWYSSGSRPAEHTSRSAAPNASRCRASATNPRLISIISETARPSPSSRHCRR